MSVGVFVTVDSLPDAEAIVKSGANSGRRTSASTVRSSLRFSHSVVKPCDGLAPVMSLRAAVNPPISDTIWMKKEA